MLLGAGPACHVRACGLRSAICAGQGGEFCRGACRLLFGGRPCFPCHDPCPDAAGPGGCAFALDMDNAQCAGALCHLLARARLGPCVAKAMRPFVCVTARRLFQ